LNENKELWDLILTPKRFRFPNKNAMRIDFDRKNMRFPNEVKKGIHVDSRNHDVSK